MGSRNGKPVTSPAPAPSSTGVLSYLIRPSMAVLMVVGLIWIAMRFLSKYRAQYTGDPSSELSRRHRQLSREGIESSLPSDHPPRSNLCRGVDPIKVSALPVYSYSSNGKNLVDCAICLSEFEEKESVKVIPFCQHMFHPLCINAWLSSHITCPVCRSSQFSCELKVGDGLGVEQETCD